MLRIIKEINLQKSSSVFYETIHNTLAHNNTYRSAQYWTNYDSVPSKTVFVFNFDSLEKISQQPKSGSSIFIIFLFFIY